MQCLGHMYTYHLFITHLQYKCNREYCILICSAWQPETGTYHNIMTSHLPLQEMCFLKPSGTHMRLYSWRPAQFFCKHFSAQISIRTFWSPSTSFNTLLLEFSIPPQIFTKEKISTTVGGRQVAIQFSEVASNVWPCFPNVSGILTVDSMLKYSLIISIILTGYRSLRPHSSLF